MKISQIMNQNIYYIMNCSQIVSKRVIIFKELLLLLSPQGNLAFKTTFCRVLWLNSCKSNDYSKSDGNWNGQNLLQYTATEYLAPSLNLTDTRSNMLATFPTQESR